MLSSNTPRLNLILLIEVTFSTPTGDYTNYPHRLFMGESEPLSLQHLPQLLPLRQALLQSGFVVCQFLREPLGLLGADKCL